MTKKPTPRSNAGSAGDNGPQNIVPGIETALTAAISIASKQGPVLAQAIYHKLKGTDPLLIQILKSTWENKQFFITLSVRNLTEHGIYLEDISIEKPKDTPLLMSDPIQANTIGLRNKTPPKSWLRSDRFLPILLSPEIEQQTRLDLRLDDFNTVDNSTLVLASRPTVTIILKISRLDQAKPEDRKITVRLRKHAEKSKPTD